MNSQKTKVTFFIIIMVLVIIGGWYFLKKSVTKPVDQNVVQNSSGTTNTPIYDADGNEVISNDYVGTIGTSTDGKSGIYSSQKYSLRFSYPIAWRVGDNHLGYGTFQLFNYSESETQKFFGKGQNKIEASISTSNIYASSTDDPEKTRQTKQVTIAGQTTNVDDVKLVGGEKIRAYFVPLPTLPGEYLGISIYGDQSNFHILDEIMQSLEWTK